MVTGLGPADHDWGDAEIALGRQDAIVREAQPGDRLELQYFVGRGVGSELHASDIVCAPWTLEDQAAWYHAQAEDLPADPLQRWARQQVASQEAACAIRAYATHRLWWPLFS